MRWAAQLIDRDDDRAPSLLDATLPTPLSGLIRTVRSPEFEGVTFYEVRARSILNRVPGSSRVPFGWTINPYRGCTHACVYCFARSTHSYLDFDAGADFDRQIVVKVNAAEVLRRELSRPSWTAGMVALGTNTDPYQRAEGRYELMPGIIDALTDSGTPFSILTKGTLLRRDLPRLAAAAQQVEVGLGVSLALMDEQLHTALEPGAPSPRARLSLIRAIASRGLPCQVLVAPVLPLLTDSDDDVDRVLSAVAAAGATGASVMALHLRPGSREWFFGYLGRYHPTLVEPYNRLYERGAYVLPSYAADLSRRTQRLLRRYGLDCQPTLRLSRSGPPPAGASTVPPGTLF